MRKVIFLILFAISLFASTQKEIIMESISTFDEFTAIPEESIPPKLLSNAKAIAIIPHVIKAGFIVGGRYGKGVLLVKNKKGFWSDPLFIVLKGGSLGWQIGAQSIDIVLVFKTDESVKNVLNGKITLGADASIAAGPVGRNAEAATDIKLHSEIYSYSRAKGLFAGISLAGAVLELDESLITNFYKIPKYKIQYIIDGRIKSSSSLVNELKKRIYEYAK